FKSKRFAIIKREVYIILKPYFFLLFDSIQSSNHPDGFMRQATTFMEFCRVHELSPAMRHAARTRNAIA
ncbi:MAG: hypothetical protein R8K20_06285, partial [Gallionellaceae bacterium]